MYEWTPKLNWNTAWHFPGWKEVSLRRPTHTHKYTKDMCPFSHKQNTPGSWRSSARYPQQPPLAGEGPIEPQLSTLLSLERNGVRNVRKNKYITSLHSFSSICPIKNNVGSFTTWFYLKQALGHWTEAVFNRATIVCVYTVGKEQQKVLCSLITRAARAAVIIVVMMPKPIKHINLQYFATSKHIIQIHQCKFSYSLDLLNLWRNKNGILYRRVFKLIYQHELDSAPQKLSCFLSKLDFLSMSFEQWKYAVLSKWEKTF